MTKLTGSPALKVQDFFQPDSLAFIVRTFCDCDGKDFPNPYSGGRGGWGESTILERVTMNCLSTLPCHNMNPLSMEQGQNTPSTLVKTWGAMDKPKGKATNL